MKGGRNGMSDNGGIAAFIAAILMLFVLAGPGFAAQQDAALPLYRDAVNLLLQGRYEEAAASLENLLKNFPSSSRAADASDKLAFCLEKLGNQRAAFLRYRETSEKWAGSLAARRSAQNAVRLARMLRQNDGDLYDQYLRGLLEGQGVASDAAARLTAISMAEIGNWNGLDRLIEGLEQGPALEQIRISELLRARGADARVRTAFIKALARSANPIVRLNALSLLSHYIDEDVVRSALVTAMRADKDPNLRSMAARSLARALDRDDVGKAFRAALQEEKSALVLMPIANLLNARGMLAEYEPAVLARLREERDPMTKVILTGMLQGAGMSSDEGLVVVQTLADNPEAGVRISALRLLQSHSDDPEIRGLFMRKLENDPNVAVRTIALNALSAQIADADVRRLVIETVKTAEDVGLVATSVKALGSQVRVPEVRRSLEDTLRSVETPVIAWQVTVALAPEFDDPEIGSLVIDKLKQPVAFEIKSAISAAMENVRVLPEGFEDLFLQEPNDALAGGYLRVIQRIKPEVAAELVKKRPLRGFTFEMRIESRKK